MALEISLAQFNKIATGDYNAGQIDIKTGKNGQELVKINNHVWQTGKNNVILSPERILEVKEAFLNALEKAAVPKPKMAEIRARIGLPAEMDVASTNQQLAGILKERYTPLSRALVRELLDTYAKYGKGYTSESAKKISYDDYMAAWNTSRMDADHVATRDRTNFTTSNLYNSQVNPGGDFSITDITSLLSTSRSLSDIETAQNNRINDKTAVTDKLSQHTTLVNSFHSLISQALKMLSADVRESQEFRLPGDTAKLVKDDNGNLSAIVGKGAFATKIHLNMDAETFVMRLMGRTVVDAETLGADKLKSILGEVYDRDLEDGLVVGETTSLTRKFAALILVNKSGSKLNMDALVKGTYNTGVLVEMAERAIAGEDVGDCKTAIDAYHEKLKTDNANLPEDMKAMLANVASIPLEKPGNGEGEFIVKAPITGDVNKVVKALPPPAPGHIATVPRDIGGIDGIKDFVANLVFSDDTMVGDVVVNKAGESMRKILSDDKNVIALAEIIKNPSLLKSACAPQIADVVQEGFSKLISILDEAFTAKNGKSLAAAAKEDDFLAQFSLFVKDSGKLPGAELAKFDTIILAMATKGCEKIQEFINKDVFKVNTGNLNDKGGIVGNPYEGLEAKEIKTQLEKKGLNEILDAAANSDSPGQVGFFKQVISTYFTSLGKADKRSCFSAALKYAKSFDFGELKGKELESAQAAAINKFTGAILKGTSPLLQKMMQGLPKDIMGSYADALDDMKSSLAPIPRKIVQAHFMQMIKESQEKEDRPEIESIELVKSLGAASVGEAFLCKFKMKDEAKPRDLVVKIMRHDAEQRVDAEAKIFTVAAQKIGPGMEKTWKGQLDQYMTEFDFRNEAKNVNEGEKLYNIAGDKKHPLNAIGRHVNSMKMSTIVPPKKDVMVAEVAPGKTVDKYFKEKIAGIRNAASAIFEQDPATGRIKWVDGPIDPETKKPKKVPVFRQNVSGASITNMIEWCHNNYNDIKSAQKMLVEATKVWFHEALLGSGKFHGDTHAGNLMVKPGSITFIDFGNLYELKSDAPLLDEKGNAVIDPSTNQPKTVNERHELLRIIMGATFRDKTFILDGFEKLLSPEGKALLNANRAKAEAVLEPVLKKGRFSYDMVYRLNAVVSELQKIGLELPPQINCFVQSMARLSNTLSEMNTIVNQANLLLETADDHVMPGPAQKRDELDILGMAFDYRTSSEGRTKVKDDIGAADVQKGGEPVQITSYFHRLSKEGFGGFSLANNYEDLAIDGKYYNKVVDRIAHAADPLAEATKLYEMLNASVDAEHSDNTAAQVDGIKEFGLKELNDAMNPKDKKDVAPQDNKDKKHVVSQEEKTAAAKRFAMRYCAAIKGIFSSIQATESQLVTTRTWETVEKPTSFANAIMTTIMDNYDALSTTFEDAAGKLTTDVYWITSNELKVGWFAGADARVQAVKDDALKMAGDNSYQIDIGV